MFLFCFYLFSTLDHLNTLSLIPLHLPSQLSLPLLMCFFIVKKRKTAQGNEEHSIEIVNKGENPCTKIKELNLNLVCKGIKKHRPISEDMQWEPLLIVGPVDEENAKQIEWQCKRHRIVIYRLLHLAIMAFFFEIKYYTKNSNLFVDIINGLKKSQQKKVEHLWEECQNLANAT